MTAHTTEPKVWLSADAHFFHEKLLEYVPSRPKNYMHTIIERHNEVVTNDDIWICLGDISAGLGKVENAKEKLKNIIKFLNGKQKILIIGNHDHFDIDFYKECGFNLVTTSISKDLDMFCHYPLENNEYTTAFEKLMYSGIKEKNIKRLFHGHTHCRNVQIDDGIERINCCLDANDYYPIEYFKN